MADRQKLVYDWNTVGDIAPLTQKRVLLNDETLRDGLQSPTVRDPAIEDKIHLLHLMEDLGIDTRPFRTLIQFWMSATKQV
jgi:2-isopropylmalate synthase